MHKLLLLTLLSATPSPPPDATTTQRGLVNTKAQAFSGLKTFDGGLVASTINGEMLGPTTGDLELWIAPDGSDANPCSSSLPCATVNAALAKVPKKIRHPVRIYADAGTYAPANIVIEGFDLTGFGYLYVIGTSAQIAVDGGSAVGTLTAVANTNPGPTLTDSSQTWVPNALKGSFVRMTSGSASGNASIVIGNTATVLSIANPISGTVAIGNTYQLYEPATFFASDAGATDPDQGLIVRSITGRSTYAPTAAPFDGGSYASILFHNVRLRQDGASNFVLRAQEVGGRFGFVDSVTENGTHSFTGRTEALFYSRVVMRARTSQTAMTIGAFAEIRGFTGPTYSQCSTASCWSLRSSTLAYASSGNNVIEVPSGGVGGIFMTGSVLRASASATNAGLVITCASTGSNGVQIEGASISLNGSTNVFDAPYLNVSGCGTGVIANGPTEVGLFNSTFTGVTTAFNATRGAHFRLNTAPSLTTVTNEISVDGTVFTFATLNAASPQVVPTTPNAYGSWVSR